VEAARTLPPTERLLVSLQAAFMEGGAEVPGSGNSAIELRHQIRHSHYRIWYPKIIQVKKIDLSELGLDAAMLGERRQRCYLGDRGGEGDARDGSSEARRLRRHGEG
jgi:hypothetical protein